MSVAPTGLFSAVCSIEGVHDLFGQYPYRWGRSSFAFLIVIVAIVIAIAGDLKRMQASSGRRDYLTLLSSGTAPPG